MNVGAPGRLIASGFGLAGFAVAIVAGLAAGNPSDRILTVALASMFVCHLVGLATGLIAERIVQDHMTRYREARPLDAPGGAGGDSAPNAAAHAGSS